MSDLYTFRVKSVLSQLMLQMAEVLENGEALTDRTPLKALEPCAWNRDPLHTAEKPVSTRFVEHSGQLPASPKEDIGEITCGVHRRCLHSRSTLGQQLCAWLTGHETQPLYKHFFFFSLIAP